jgi:hypothetical protein
MKKLNKLIINPEKVIKNEELVNLRGGYMGWFKCCWNEGSSHCSECVYTSSMVSCSQGAVMTPC